MTNRKKCRLTFTCFTISAETSKAATHVRALGVSTQRVGVTVVVFRSFTLVNI